MAHAKFFLHVAASLTGLYYAPLKRGAPQAPAIVTSTGDNETLVNLKSPLFRGRLFVAAALFAVVAGFFWKITLTSQFDWAWGPDLATQVTPWFAVQARRWHQGTFPLWDPFLWAGQPLLGQAQPGAGQDPADVDRPRPPA